MLGIAGERQLQRRGTARRGATPATSQPHPWVSYFQKDGRFLVPCLVCLPRAVKKLSTRTRGGDHRPKAHTAWRHRKGRIATIATFLPKRAPGVWVSIDCNMFRRIKLPVIVSFVQHFAGATHTIAQLLYMRGQKRCHAKAWFEMAGRAASAEGDMGISVTAHAVHGHAKICKR